MWKILVNRDKIVSLEILKYVFIKLYMTRAIGRMDMIKVDIEGAELSFFRGAEQVLKKYNPKLVLESNENYCGAFNNSVVDV